MQYETQVRNSRILLVDDLIANVSLLENILNRLAYKQIRNLTDPLQVAAVVEEWKPDIIVLDLAMPHLNGFKVMEQLRNQISKEDWIPILVLTADTDPGTKRKALAAGATEFLAKPFDSSEIVLRIRNLLLMRILRAELQNQNEILEERVAARTRSLSERTEQLEQALAELKTTQQQVVQQERFRAFGEMAGGVAHDFNNVLMCVIGYTDLLLGDSTILQEPETVREFLRTMNTAGHDASQIVARLRNFYRPREASEIFTPIDLNTLVKEVAPLTQPKWKTQALSTGRVIELEFDLATLPSVMCNPADMREVLVNLIFNAVDAMPNGGTITLRTRCENGVVAIGVSDAGTGMSSEVRERCMEPFFSTKGDNGTGLGLSMVFGIIKRHEGTIDIDTEIGKGTTFWIRLKTSNEALERTELEEIGVQRSLHVLAVDDEPMARDLVTRYLNADGHSVVVANNGESAWEKFQAEKFDLLITDHAMPGMTGIQLSAAVKSVAANQPIIMLTSLSDPIFETGEKPPTIDKLLNKAISQKGLRHAICEVMREVEALRDAEAIRQPESVR